MYAYIAFFTVILSYGMETAFFRFSQKYKDNPDVINSSLLTLIFSSLAFFVAVAIFAQPIASAIGYPNNPEYIVYFAAILALDTICILPFANLRNLNRPIKFATFKTVNIVANIAFNLFFIVLCPILLKHYPDSVIKFIYNEKIGVGYIFIANLLASVLQMLCFIPDFLKIRLKYNRKLMKEMLIYALPVMIWGLAGIVNETIDRVLLKHLLPAGIAMAELGIYGACYKVSILMTLFIQAFRFAAEPFFFKQAESKDKKQTYANVMYYFVIACLLIFLLCTLFLNDIMLFVGKDFREGAKVVPILLIANMFLGIYYNLSVWYKITDQTKFGAYISTVGAAITIALNFLLIPFMGYMGAAWATLACYFVISVISYFLGQKHFPVPYKIAKMAILFFAAVLLYLGNFYLNDMISFNIWISRAIASGFFVLFLLLVFLVRK
jgi:O-antigen/teichoic acid export membrane protein